MPLHLEFSNQTEELFQSFQKTFQGKWVSPLDPPTLLMPNPIVNKWLHLEWAKTQGVVFNLSTQFLENFFWGFLCHDSK